MHPSLDTSLSIQLEYREFMEQVIEISTEAARRDYTKPEQRMMLLGSLQGFKKCLRIDGPKELWDLMNLTYQMSRKHQGRHKSHWFFRCQVAEIEWVANVMSVVLIEGNHRPILSPTLQGYNMARRVCELLAKKKAH